MYSGARNDWGSRGASGRHPANQGSVDTRVKPLLFVEGIP